MHSEFLETEQNFLEMALPLGKQVLVYLVLVENYQQQNLVMVQLFQERTVTCTQSPFNTADSTSAPQSPYGTSVSQPPFGLPPGSLQPTFGPQTSPMSTSQSPGQRSPRGAITPTNQYIQGAYGKPPMQVSQQGGTLGPAPNSAEKPGGTPGVTPLIGG
jgi:hypothetical protein